MSVQYVIIGSLALLLLGIAIYKCRRIKPVGKAQLNFVFSLSNQIKVSGQNLMARIKNTQSVKVELKPVDRQGNPAEVQEGSVVWASSDESVATVTPDPENEMKATVNSVGLGVAQITAKADADLEDGVVEITGSGAIEVVSGTAVGFELSFSEPEEEA